MSAGPDQSGAEDAQARGVRARGVRATDATGRGVRAKGPRERDTRGTKADAGPTADVVPLHPAAREDADAPARAPLRVLPPAEYDRVGIVLVSRSRALAQATLNLAVGLLAGTAPAPVAAAGRNDDGVVAAARQVDEGVGVALLCDLEETALALAGLLERAEELALPFPIRLCDAPLVEGAVPAVATAAVGGDLAAVVEAAEDAYRVHKTDTHHRHPL